MAISKGLIMAMRACLLMGSLSLGGPFMAFPQAHQLTDEVWIDPDRPHVADSSVNVPPGHYLQENGLQITYHSHHRDFDLPETLIRLGVLKRTELRLNVPNYFISKADESRLSNTQLGSGFQDIQVGFKHRLGPLAGNIELAVNPYISIPTGARNQTSHKVDFSIKFPFACPLSEKWELEGMESLFFPTIDGRRNRDWQNSILLNRRWGKKTDAFVEYANDIFQRGRSSHILLFGVAHRPSRKHQLDARVGFKLSGAAPRAFFGVGYSFLLGKLH